MHTKYLTTLPLVYNAFRNNERGKTISRPLQRKKLCFGILYKRIKHSFWHILKFRGLSVFWRHFSKLFQLKKKSKQQSKSEIERGIQIYSHIYVWPQMKEGSLIWVRLPRAVEKVTYFFMKKCQGTFATDNLISTWYVLVFAKLKVRLLSNEQT